MASPTRCNMSLNKFLAILKDSEGWCAVVHGVVKSWTWLGGWTTTTMHWKRPWFWERLKAKGEEGGRGWDDHCITDTMGMSLSKFQETVKDREAWCAAVHGVAKSWTQTSDWTRTGRIRQLPGHFRAIKLCLHPSFCLVLWWEFQQKTS